MKLKLKKKKWLISAAVLAVLALLLLSQLTKEKDVPLLDLTDTTVLAYTDLEDSIAATGVVESADTRMVYSTVAYPVMAVHAEVGDRVEAGQVLAELDAGSIRDQIASQEISMGVSSQSAAQQIYTAQTNYDNYKSGLDQGLNATLNSAENQAETAYNSYLKARDTYERYRDSLDVGENTALINAESALRNAENALETAADTYNSAWEADRDAQSDLEAAETAWLEGEALLTDLNEQLANAQTDEERAQLEGQLQEASLALEGLTAAYDAAMTLRDQTDAALEQAERSLDNAAAACESQRAAYNAAVTTADNTLADYLTAMDTAWDTYQDALVSVQSTEKSVQDQLKTYENSLASAQLGANQDVTEESLRQLQESLADATITAPCAGTVTAVYAEVGSTGSGLLFVIEDVENLIVETTVKGYDMGTVQEGMEVVIRSDATGSAKMHGVISSIAPTSKKTPQGQTDTNSEAVFAAEVAVTDRNTGLRIGMEAQLNYIIRRENHVLAVPYDAVYENDEGQTCILLATEQPDGKFTITEHPVTTGMDDDLDMAITGAGVQEGLRVIHAPDSYLHLLGQTVTAGTNLKTMPFGMMGG